MEELCDGEEDGIIRVIGLDLSERPKMELYGLMFWMPSTEL